MLNIRVDIVVRFHSVMEIKYEIYNYKFVLMFQERRKLLKNDHNLLLLLGLRFILNERYRPRFLKFFYYQSRTIGTGRMAWSFLPPIGKINKTYRNCCNNCLKNVLN